MLFLLTSFIIFLNGAKLSCGLNSVCLQAPVKKLEVECRARIPTYYYDKNRGYCGCFYYKGCGGTENRFNSLSECMITCSVGPDRQTDLTPCVTLQKISAALPSTPPISSSGGVVRPSKPKPELAGASISTCDQPLAQGKCLDYIPSFYYNKASGMCDCFIYSGCEGNTNRFKTMKRCMSTCGVDARNQAITDTCKRDFEGTNILLQLLNDNTLKGVVESNKPLMCEQPPKPGTCRAYLPSFYYNRKLGMCDCFIYTGCQGNENRFKSLYDCVNRCGLGLKDQEVTFTCKEQFNGTQILIDLLNDERLRGNNLPGNRDTGQPSTSSFGFFGFFPALPVHPRPQFIRDLPKRVFHSASPDQSKSIRGDHVTDSFFESAQHSWQDKK